MSTFGRIVEVVIGDMVIQSPPLTIEIDVPFSDGSDGHAADVSTVRFYNLSDESVAKIEEGTPVVVRAGYEGDVGTVAVGTIEDASTKWDGVDKVTTLLVGDGTDMWLTRRVNRTWRAGVKASEVARDIVGLLGLSVGRIDLPDDVSYPRGRSLSTSAKAALEGIAEDTGARLHVTRQAVYLVPPRRHDRIGVVLSSDTGLLDSPEPLSDPPGAYQVRMLLQHRIVPDAMVEMRSRTANGEFRVQSGRHQSGLSEHVTIATVVPV